jgi:uncharacterized membrane protein (UPF0127 family)
MLRREDDGRVVCEHCVVADTLPRRLRGLLGRRRLPAGAGIVLRPAWSIHTAFLRFPIDVVFVDADQVVLEIVPNLKPWRTALCHGARDVVELAAGECARRGLKPGDRIAWAARPARDEGELTALAGSMSQNGHSNESAVPAPYERPIYVLMATRDDRFLNTARFILPQRDFLVESTKRLEDVVDLVEKQRTDVVVLDATESLSEAARTVAAMEALHPHVRISVVSEGGRPRPTRGLKVVDKWDGLETLRAEILGSPAGSTAWR